MTATILGARSFAQLDDNLAAAGLHLSDEQTAVPDKASSPPAGDYPYGELGRQQRDRGVAGTR